MQLAKYLAIIKISWNNGFVYRLNFIMWRVRSVIQLIVVYSLWASIFTNNREVFGYSEKFMLTYILGTSTLASFVISSRSVDVGAEIASGDLNNFLTKPLNYFANWLSRDLSDKALNLIFKIFEIGLFLVILKPPIFLQLNLIYLLPFFLSAVFAMFIYFFLSFIISSTAFWYPEDNSWPARFLFMVIIEFLSGTIFPLDILPRLAFSFFSRLPSAYFLYYPLQIYLGRITVHKLPSIIFGQVIWLSILYLAASRIWKRGLKVYGAYGR